MKDININLNFHKAQQTASRIHPKRKFNIVLEALARELMQVKINKSI